MIVIHGALRPSAGPDRRPRDDHRYEIAAAGFSREGLFEQLEYEGHTASQAGYGASRTYG